MHAGALLHCLFYKVRHRADIVVDIAADMGYSVTGFYRSEARRGSASGKPVSTAREQIRIWAGEIGRVAAVGKLEDKEKTKETKERKEPQKKSIQWKSSLMLFMAAFIWGTAFVAQSVGMEYLGPLSFNGARFLLGSIVLVPVICLGRRRRLGGKKEGKQKGSLKTTVTGGICCGLALCAASLLQQYGIRHTTVGKAGFITTLYIILVPFFGVFLKKRIPGKVWVGAVIAAFGMYLLCMSGSFSLGRGDTLVFLCAILFSVHILVIDHFSPRVDGVELSCIQFLTAGVIGSILAFLFEKPDIWDFIHGLVPVAYAGILSCGVAYTLQVLGQRDTDPTVASLILSLESVVSVLAGWVILRQALMGRELAGCALVFCAVILVQLPMKKGKSEKQER